MKSSPRDPPSLLSRPPHPSAGIWVKPGRDRDHLSELLQQEGYIPVWIDPTLVRRKGARGVWKDISCTCGKRVSVGVWIDPATLSFSTTLISITSPLHLPPPLSIMQLDLYYNGLCNTVLWQLFHYVPIMYLRPYPPPPLVQLDLYYNGFCNTVLWQLFHYVPLNIDSWQKMAEHRAMQMQWQAYQV